MPGRGIQTGRCVPRRSIVAIGETGFEPATARPPAECATRLRHSPWGFAFCPIGRPGVSRRAGAGSISQTKHRCERLFVFVFFGLCGGAGAVMRRRDWRTSPGGARLAGSATTIADLAAPPTSRSTIGPTAGDISTRPRSGRRPSRPNGLPISSRIYASIPARIVARRIRSSSSSTIFEIRNSTSPRGSETATGTACSTRLQSARWFVQTVTDAAPLVGVASLARW
jgi:hypothetical protein